MLRFLLTINTAISRTKFVKLSEIPLAEALLEVQRNPEPPEPSAKGWKKMFTFLWD